MQELKLATNCPTTNKLRYKTLWMTIGFFGLVLLGYLSLTRSPHHALKFTGGDKIEHIIAFVVITLWWGQLYTGLHKLVKIALGFLAASIVLELLQRQIGGYPALEYGDIIASGLGVAAGLIMLQSPLGFLLLNIESLIEKTISNNGG